MTGWLGWRFFAERGFPPVFTYGMERTESRAALVRMQYLGTFQARGGRQLHTN